MNATDTLPYFIKPSQSLNKSEKRQAYAQAQQAILATIGDEADPIVKMVTINSLLKTHLPYFYWVGFYQVRNNRLLIGPYQGTLGCLYVDFDRGVCGKAARTQQTQIVEDVQGLIQGKEHIACDPNSRSEIVVPVFNAQEELIAVFDVDSTLAASFDEVDQEALENLMNMVFG